jgi:hypothetical protein
VPAMRRCEDETGMRSRQMEEKPSEFACTQGEKVGSGGEKGPASEAGNAGFTVEHRAPESQKGRDVGFVERGGSPSPSPTSGCRAAKPYWTVPLTGSAAVRTSCV